MAPSLPRAPATGQEPFTICSSMLTSLLVVQLWKLVACRGAPILRLTNHPAGQGLVLFPCTSIGLVLVGHQGCLLSHAKAMTQRHLCPQMIVAYGLSASVSQLGHETSSHVCSQSRQHELGRTSKRPAASHCAILSPRILIWPSRAFSTGDLGQQIGRCSLRNVVNIQHGMCHSGLWQHASTVRNCMTDLNFTGPRSVHT